MMTGRESNIVSCMERYVALYQNWPTLSEISEITDIPVTTVFNDLQSLVEAGIVKKPIKHRTRSYVLKGYKLVKGGD